MLSDADYRRPVRVAVVGVGNVGATFAYALLLGGIASEIVLIDANHAKAEGEAMDLNHTVPFTHSTRVWAGDFADCAGASVDNSLTAQNPATSSPSAKPSPSALASSPLPRTSAAAPMLCTSTVSSTLAQRSR